MTSLRVEHRAPQGVRFVLWVGTREAVVVESIVLTVRRVLSDLVYVPHCLGLSIIFVLMVEEAYCCRSRAVSG
jgi:hypothetical protein